MSRSTSFPRDRLTDTSSLVFHYAANVGKLSPASTSSLHISRAEEILNKEAGWKSLTGTTNFETIANSSDPSMQLAFDIFIDRIGGFIGAYYVSLAGRVDALVFAGGIGERSARLRSEVSQRIQCLGFSLDKTRNQDDMTAVVQDISADNTRPRILVCKTDEQFEMARSCTRN